MTNINQGAFLAQALPAKTSPRHPAVLELARGPDESQAEQLGRASVTAAFANTAAAQLYQSHLVGEGADLMATISAVGKMVERVKDGDLSDMEAMLVAQATALQTMFASLARRAQGQQHQRNLEAFINLALKAQAQSRATISALVDLKYPRQATFVKQANITSGAQQVNNGVPGPPHATRTKTGECAPNELLGVEHGQVINMDAGTQAAAARGDSALAAVGAVNRTANRRRKAARGA